MPGVYLGSEHCVAFVDNSDFLDWWLYSALFLMRIVLKTFVTPESEISRSDCFADFPGNQWLWNRVDATTSWPRVQHTCPAVHRSQPDAHRRHFQRHRAGTGHSQSWPTLSSGANANTFRNGFDVFKNEFLNVLFSWLFQYRISGVRWVYHLPL